MAIVVTSQRQRDHLGAAVTQARTSAALSQQQLAREAGLKRGQVTRLEHGLAAPAHVLRAVLKVLEQHHAMGLDALRDAVAALPVARPKPYRPPAYDQPWAHEWPVVRLRVACATGIAFPGGQAPAGAVIRVKASARHAEQWLRAADHGWAEPVEDADRDALVLMRRKVEEPSPLLVLHPHPAWSPTGGPAHHWRRLGPGGTLLPPGW